MVSLSKYEISQWCSRPAWNPTFKRFLGKNNSINCGCFILRFTNDMSHVTNYKLCVQLKDKIVIQGINTDRSV